MDPLLAQLMGGTDSVETIDESPPDTFMPTAQITVIGVNYFENAHTKTTWMKSNQTIKLQFYDQTQKFTPHYNLTVHECIAQLHDPFFVERYIEAYREEEPEVVTDGQLNWYRDLIRDTTWMGSTALLGQLYECVSGTRYHWGSVARLRTDEFDQLRLDLFLGFEKFTTILLDQPNTDRNAKTKNVKWRGRYDPNKLWQTKSPKLKKAKP